MEKSEDEIRLLRSKLHEKFQNLERIEIESKAKEKPLRERMKKNPKTFDMVYNNQKDAFFNATIKKRYPELKGRAEDLFKEYWECFISETTDSIHDFMIEKGFGIGLEVEAYTITDKEDGTNNKNTI